MEDQVTVSGEIISRKLTDLGFQIAKFVERSILEFVTKPTLSVTSASRKGIMPMNVKPLSQNL